MAARRVLPLARRPLSLVAVLFFVSHIPVTLFVDSQVVLPRAWYPGWARAAFDWYGTTYGDPLVLGRPPWFRALVWVEVLLQLPFFFLGAAWFAAGDARVVKPAAAYGMSTATTLVPILAELATSPVAAAHRGALLAFYTPYLVVPLAIGVAMLAAAGGDPFVAGGGGARRRKAA